MTSADFPPNPIEKSGYQLDFHDEFDSPALNLSNWIPYYLPQWSSRQNSAPRYHIADSALVLRIDADQPPWCPEFDGEIKASSLQTGLYAGEVGSTAGQLHFNPALVVREAQTPQRTYMPQYGYFEARIKAVPFAGNHVALWMIGFEDTPEQSGEIAIFEIFGAHVEEAQSEVRYGVHPWGDSALMDEFYKDVLPMDATDFHLYAAEWTPTHLDFYVDNVKRRTIHQSPAYPMQVMLSIYELPGYESSPADYPKRFTIDYVRGYQPLGGY